MGDHERSTKRRRSVGAGAAILALGAVGLIGCKPVVSTIPGATVTTTTFDPGEGFGRVRIEVDLTTGHTLSVGCSSPTGTVTVNATVLPTNCADLSAGLIVRGTSGADSVSVDGRYLGTSEVGGTSLYLGAGDDIATVRHANGSAYIDGEAGNDRLSAGLWDDRPHLPEWSKDVLDGGAGNDTLTNLGYLTDPKHGATESALDQRNEGSTLIGGPGADHLQGDNFRFDNVVADDLDTIRLGTGSEHVERDHAPGTPVPFAVDLTRGDGDYKSVTVNLGATRRLDGGCAPGPDGTLDLVANDLRIFRGCVGDTDLAIVGTSGNDTVNFDVGQGRVNSVNNHSVDSGAGLPTSVSLGAGNDTATLLAACGSSLLDGGPGNDRLTYGLHVELATGYDAGGCYGGSVTGGAGSDTITHLGYLDGGTLGFNPDDPLQAFAPTRLDGGLGVDNVWGSNTTPEIVTAETVDTIDLGSGPTALDLTATPGSDTVRVRGNGYYGPLVDVSTAGVTKSYALTSQMYDLTVHVGAGDDAVTFEHKSAHTAIHIDTGAGTDSLLLRPRNPYQLSYAQSDLGRVGTITQPDWAPVTFAADAVEHLTVSPLP